MRAKILPLTATSGDAVTASFTFGNKTLNFSDYE
ncbi:Uncharacterised protein [Sphingobacterium daejeonense]|nr:Uncharacterised protein [Sphingobacterium daejeonense]